ncbi:MAG: hypothetical protein ACK4MX_08050 [Thermaurantiacus sp.]
MSQIRLAGAVLLSVVASTADAGRSYYVDFERGSDRATGLSPEAAWKRAPGDTRAEGVPASTRLQPGDRVLFRGGVTYRGTIVTRVSGTASAPIIFDGSGWGAAPAVFEGADPLLNVRPCRSQRDCLGAPHWRSLVRARLPEGARWTDWIFDGDTALVPAQWPSPPTQALAHRPEGFHELPAEHTASLRLGLVPVSLPPGLEAGEPVLAMHVRPGQVGYSGPVMISPDGIHFSPYRWHHWGFAPFDGANRVALMNLPSMVDRPGTFAISSQRRIAIAWPLSDRPDLRLGTGRQGFHLMSGGYITVTGFRFMNYAGGDTLSRHAATPIVQLSPLPGITLANNQMRSVVALGRPARPQELASGTPSPLIRHAGNWANASMADVVTRSPATIRGAGGLQLAGASALPDAGSHVPMSASVSGR